MIRNILYSLFIHSILIFLIYFSFNATPPIEIDKNVKVAVSFVTKAGNSAKPDAKPQETPMPAVPEKMPLPIAPKAPPKKTPPTKKEPPKPKKSKAKAEPVKSDTAKQDHPKQEPTKSKPKEIEAKSESNKPKAPNKKDEAKPAPEKPKFEEKKPEVKAEVKKDPPPKVVEKPVDQSIAADETEDENDQEEVTEPQYSFTENSIESLDLLAREKFNIQTQIKRCYKKASQENGDNKAVVNAHIFIAKDGFIDLNAVIFKIPPEKVKNGIEDSDFAKAKETVKKALKFCSPIRNLPADKYDIWKEIDLQFD